MGKYIKRVGRFYSSIIVQNIGLFLFVGMMSVLFMEDGWFPNRQFYDISQMIYKIAIPLVIAAGGGRKTGGDPGATAAILAVAGILVAGQESGILGAMILGPAAGFAVSRLMKQILKKVEPGFEMLTRNMTIALTGCVFAVVSCMVVQPVLFRANMALGYVTKRIVDGSMLPFLAIVIEPAKILFMNNGINHGVLVPLGMEQAEAAGKSVFFLLESNPGPGLGILLALWFRKKEKREKYGLCMLVHGLGGIHEVYFPYVLANLWLLPALVAGGIGGNLCFSLMRGGTAGPVSPGSVLTIMMMSRRSEWIGNVAGMAVSAVISMVAALVVLKLQSLKSGQSMQLEESIQPLQSGQQMQSGKGASQEPPQSDTEKKITSICVICDAGVGSSAMGAALIRRRLAGEHVSGIRVDARPADRIDPEADLYVCQKNFADRLGGRSGTKGMYLVENLLDASEYDKLMQMLQSGGEETHG